MRKIIPLPWYEGGGGGVLKDPLGFCFFNDEFMLVHVDSQECHLPYNVDTCP